MWSIEGIVDFGYFCSRCKKVDEINQVKITPGLLQATWPIKSYKLLKKQ